MEQMQPREGWRNDGCCARLRRHGDATAGLVGRVCMRRPGNNWRDLFRLLPGSGDGQPCTPLQSTERYPPPSPSPFLWADTAPSAWCGAGPVKKTHPATASHTHTHTHHKHEGPATVVLASSCTLVHHHPVRVSHRPRPRVRCGTMQQTQELNRN